MHSIWWKYVNLFQENCSYSKSKWTQECYEAQMRAAGVTSTIFVNKHQFHGHWACPKPINRDTCGLVKMICASYKEGEDCGEDGVSSCTPEQCTVVDRDCH